MNRIVHRGSKFYLNQTIGTLIGTTGPSSPTAADLAQGFTGLLGEKHTYTRAQAQAATDTTVTGYGATTKLEGGTYQLVKVASTITGTPVRGCLAYWHTTSANLDTFQVTPDADAGTSLFAGVFINAPAAGEYCWIQTGGLAWFLGVAAPTKTAAVGDLLFASVVSNVSRVDNKADATAITSGNLRGLVGRAYDALPGSGVSRGFLIAVCDFPGDLLA